MATLAPLVPSPVSLEDFVALNDEIAALARAGVPLGKGLLDVGSDLPGRLGRLASDIGQRIDQGETLEQVVSRSPELFPPAYRAVIEAGVKVGRLPSALEGIAHTARRTAQVQRSLSAATLYPLLLLSLAYTLLLFWLNRLQPTMGESMMLLDPASAPFWIAVDRLARESWWWGPLLPLLFVSWLTWQWWRSRQVARGIDLHPLLSFGVVWRLWRMRQCARLAAMADLLALLVEFGVPLPQAVALAGDASGDRRLRASARDMSERLSRGERTSAVVDFPPFLAWVVAAGHGTGQLPLVLRRLRDTYRDEAQRHSQWLTTFAPVVMTAIIGGITVGLMAVIYFGPVVMIIYQLTDATARAM